jgi:hypothetical protein
MDLVSQFQGDPEFVIPFGGRVAYLRVAKKGQLRTIELDGESIGEVPRASGQEPWREYAFDKEGHSFVVAFSYAFTGLARPDAATIVEVFAEGINLHDGRTLDQWRADAPAPGAMPFVSQSGRGNGIPGVPGFSVLWRIWIVVVGIVVAVEVVRGEPSMIPAVAVGWAAFAAYWEFIHLTQNWALRRTDLSEGVRLGAVMGAIGVPVIALLLGIAVIRGIR